MSYATVLPPASTPLEKALEQVAARLTDLPAPVRDVWSPSACPISHLPWLGWGLAISHWKTSWTEGQKRAAVADAVPYHRRKGSRAAVEEVLARYHPSLSIVEWHQANPRLDPHTFHVRAPASDIPASFLTLEAADAIIADVAIAKPARSHFNFVQNIDLSAAMFMGAGGVAGSVARADYGATLDESRDWSLTLQTEDGEPIFDGDSSDLLETD